MNPTVFYDQLVKHLDVTPERILMEMQEKYDKAMLSMSTKPTDFDNWVQNWGPYHDILPSTWPLSSNSSLSMVVRPQKEYYFGPTQLA